jgi:hypothetical protein
VGAFGRIPVSAGHRRWFASRSGTVPGTGLNGRCGVRAGVRSRWAGFAYASKHKVESLAFADVLVTNMCDRACAVAEGCQRLTADADRG